MQCEKVSRDKSGEIGLTWNTFGIYFSLSGYGEHYSSDALIGVLEQSPTVGMWGPEKVYIVLTEGRKNS